MILGLRASFSVVVQDGAVSLGCAVDIGIAVRGYLFLQPHPGPFFLPTRTRFGTRFEGFEPNDSEEDKNRRMEES